MEPLALANHVLNFLAPAFFVAALGTIGARFWVVKRPIVLAGSWHLAINFIASGMALAAGLWFFGVDGKMASYAAMVTASASCHWLLIQAWRK